MTSGPIKEWWESRISQAKLIDWEKIARALLIEVGSLEQQNQKFKDVAIELARDRHNEGKTILDFYALWLEQERDLSRKLNNKLAVITDAILKER